MIRSITSVFIVAIALTSCKKKKEEEIPEFDKASLLKNVADNVITPALNDFQSKLGALSTSFQTFESNVNATNLNDVRTNWKEAYLTWQAVKIYDFGPIKNNAYKGSTGIFPVDTAQINTNISNGSYVLGTIENTDAIGLASLDYLLFRVGAIDSFTINSSCVSYASDVIQKMVSETNTIITQWGAYRNSFVASTGTGSTSGFSVLVNEFNRDYEIAKNAKLGIPIGKQSLGIALPEYIEAKYSGISLELLNRSVIEIKNLFNGIGYASQANGIGFDDYLNHLEKNALASSINSKFASITSKIGTFSVSLETAIDTQYSDLDALYTLMHGQVVNLKTDMTSSFGVLITYQDTDGD